MKNEGDIWRKGNTERRKATTFRQRYYIAKQCVKLAKTLGKPINELDS